MVRNMAAGWEWHPTTLRSAGNVPRIKRSINDVSYNMSTSE